MEERVCSYSPLPRLLEVSEGSLWNSLADCPCRFAHPLTVQRPGGDFADWICIIREELQNGLLLSLLWLHDQLVSSADDVAEALSKKTGEAILLAVTFRQGGGRNLFCKAPLRRCLWFWRRPLNSNVTPLLLLPDQLLRCHLWLHVLLGWPRKGADQFCE